MNIQLLINESADAAANYVTWAPSKCSLLISGTANDMDIVLKNKSMPGGGKVVFMKEAATKGEPLKELHLRARPGIAVKFGVAGKFGHASINDKDTTIEVYNTASGQLIHSQALMVRVRKNANKLTDAERDRLLKAFAKLRLAPAKGTYAGPSGDRSNIKHPKYLLDELVLIHTEDAALEIHNRESFHPWHRIFLLHVERELQAIDSSVTIPFWKFDEGADQLFTEDFVGKTALRQPTKEEDDKDPEARTKFQVPIRFSKTHPWSVQEWQTVWGQLYRSYCYDNPAKGKPWERIQSENAVLSAYTKFSQWRDFEEYKSHNGAHWAFGGQVADIGKDPCDPLFFMLHANVDRLWAKWQKMHKRWDAQNTNTYSHPGERPAPKRKEFGHSQFNNPKNQQLGNYLQDTLWPWDKDYDTPRPNPKKAARGMNKDKYRKSANITLNVTDSAAVSHPGHYPKVIDTIDYQGTMNLESNLGMAYVDVPYFQKLDLPTLSFESIQTERKAKLETLLNAALPLKDRLGAFEELPWLEAEEQGEVLELVKNNKNDDQLRLAALKTVFVADEESSDLMLELLADQHESYDIRLMALRHFANSKRSSNFFFARQSDFFASLRVIASEENNLLRFEAIELLASNTDSFVQDLLSTELAKDSSKLIAKEDAIFYLSMDLHGNYSDQFEKLLASDPSSSVRAAAARGLANNVESAPALLMALKNAQEDPVVRTASARALHIQNPAEMIQAAREALIGKSKLEANGESSPEVQTLYANMLLHTADIDELKKDKELVSEFTRKNFLKTFQSFSAESGDASVSPLELMLAELKQELIS